MVIRCSTDTAAHVTITVSILHIYFLPTGNDNLPRYHSVRPFTVGAPAGKGLLRRSSKRDIGSSKSSTGLRRVSAASPVSVNYCVNYWLNNEASLLPSATRLRRLCFYTYLSVHGGGVRREYLGRHTPRTRHTPTGKHPPPGITILGKHSPPRRRLTLRTARVLLECILVHTFGLCTYFFAIEWTK